MEAKMDFLADIPRWHDEKPYELFLERDPQTAKSNLEFHKEQTVHLQEIRSSGRCFSLDADGFEVVPCDFHLVPRAADLEDPTKVDTIAIPLLEETLMFLKLHLGVEVAFCFDWRVRVQGRMQNDPSSLDGLKNIRHEAIRPAKVVHIDYSWEGGKFKFEQHLRPEELKKYSNGAWRARLINVWRPLTPVIQNFPLAFCHSRSVKSTDLVEKDNVHPCSVVGSLYLLNRPYHEWFYLQEQRSDEAWIFLSWDSDENPDQPQCPPHCSFEVSDAPLGALPRESVEVRFIVITKKAVNEGC